MALPAGERLLEPQRHVLVRGWRIGKPDVCRSALSAFFVHENQGISYGTNFPALFQVSSEFRVFEDAIQVLWRDCNDLSTFAAPEWQLQLAVLLEFIRVLFENQLAHEASQPFGSRHASGSHNLIEIAANLPAHHAVKFQRQ